MLQNGKKLVTSFQRSQPITIDDTPPENIRIEKNKRKNIDGIREIIIHKPTSKIVRDFFREKIEMLIDELEDSD